MHSCHACLAGVLRSDCMITSKELGHELVVQVLPAVEHNALHAKGFGQVLQQQWQMHLRTCLGQKSHGMLRINAPAGRHLPPAC